MQTIKVGNMCAKTGEKVSGYVQVKGTDIELPVTIICGEKEGKTVFISGGGHSADYYIDLHCGDGYEELTPYVYCVGVAAPEVVKAARGMAELVNVPYLVQSPSGSGGSYNYAGSCGIPSILIERGCMGRWSKEEVKLGKEDVRNVLRYLKVLQGEVSKRTYHPMDVGKVICKKAEYTGCWYPTKRVGDNFKKGEILGYIKDYFGNVLETYAAEMDGILLYQVSSLCVIKDGPMVAYGEKINN